MKELDNIIECPHCNLKTIIIAINCGIFRCGILKANYEQINPHLSKIECDELKANDLIYGCGKPYRVSDNNIAIQCDYI